MLKGTIEGAEGPGTTVGVNVALSGTLKDQNDITIYGMADGEVISEKAIMVGQTAQVKGPVRGQTVTVAGIVRGSIDASLKLEILETGKVFGSITAKDLVIHSGAIFVGKSSMASDEQEVEETEEVAAEPDDKTDQKVKDNQESSDKSVELPQPDEE